MTVYLRGLTWNHPRATEPLRAAAAPLRRLHDVSVDWDVQPLAGFEARPIAEAARAYDLVIFDHPHVGEIAAQHLFHPVDRVLEAASLTDADFVGPSLATYRYEQQTWGLPLDAACQVCCARIDLLNELDAEWPATWSEVLELGELARRRGCYLGMAFAGVHSLMTLFSLCANQAMPLMVESAQAFPERSAARAALAAMSELLPFCAAEVLDWNSIAAQEAMCSRDDLVFCPAVYGFAPYANTRRAVRLAYADLPGLAPGHAGSVIGGAGLGVSSFTQQPDAALAVASFLIDAHIQEDLIAAHDGQPARAGAWDCAAVNERSGNFYAATRLTMQQAWIRPRFDGYLHFQRAGGGLVEAFLRGSASMDLTLDRLEEVWAEARLRDH